MPGTAFNVEPQLIRLQYGGWLATSSSTTKLRIGVIGTTEDDARAQFKASLTRWKEISEIEEG